MLPLFFFHELKNITQSTKMPIFVMKLCRLSAFRPIFSS